MRSRSLATSCAKLRGLEDGGEDDDDEEEEEEKSSLVSSIPNIIVESMKLLDPWLPCRWGGLLVFVTGLDLDDGGDPKGEDEEEEEEEGRLGGLKRRSEAAERSSDDFLAGRELHRLRWDVVGDESSLG